MSASIKVHHRSLTHRALQTRHRGPYRPKHDPSVDFANSAWPDALSYREALDQPPCLSPGTGLGFIDTPITFIYDGITTELPRIKGFKFNYQGVKFQIESPNIPGTKPKYSLTVLSSDINQRAETEYRMTREDALFALSCLRAEISTEDVPEITKLAETYEKNLGNPVQNENKVQITREIDKFEISFMHHDRKYSVLFKGAKDPVFRVNGSLPSNSPNEREMTLHEIKFFIPKASRGISLENATMLGARFAAMRDFQYELQDKIEKIAKATAAANATANANITRQL